jgi:two-component system chemotaxis sensor kinase CheA
MTETGENFDDESMSGMVTGLRETFREEAYDLIAELEAALLELEKTPGDAELIDRVFRALHTIKGSGATCEFHDISAFTHQLESVFDLVRKGKLVVSRELIDLTLAARDHIQAMFDGYYRRGESDPARGQAILASFKKLLPAGGEKPSPAVGPVGPSSTYPPDAAPEGKDITYRIRFRPTPDSVAQGEYPAQALQELRRLGTCRVVAQADAILMREDVQPGRRYTHWDVILTTARGIDAIHDAFLFMEHMSDLKVDVLDDGGGSACTETTHKKLGEILLERGDLTRDDLQKALASQKRLGTLLVEAEAVAPSQVESALAEQQVRDLREKRQSTDISSTIRVATEKLDSLVNLIGEMVTVQARLSQTVAAKGYSDLLTVAEDVERLTASLRDNTLSIRMLPIGTTFSRFRRLVRDLSTELGKEAELVTDGAETELDKTVIERLGDPLVHLIRNCIDHGIETPGAREATGKPRRGTLRLSAEHSGAHVLIRIQDDGAGLDTEAIRAKALERGLMRADAELSDNELHAFIFAPGFSTARSVTSVSGRGVGLEVVKKSIDALRGSLEINSTKGAGTAITLKLPLTLAIIDGFLTRIGAEYFVFPLSLVAECVELPYEDRHKGDNQLLSRHLINVRGEIVPYVRLRDQFLIKGEPPPVEQVIITGMNGNRVGFVVDHVIGSHQTVIKNLGTFYRNVEGISGATILGDGTVAMILDVTRLVKSAVMDEKAS